eukprot:TRINITY_DN2067_c0_g1_i3.p1 TRINITY_DN2067_c0_g1~~TRINITY_DN2067_c0_g1_i3.p1  ORF type:complete len:213 (+),score=53.05 TRINITY_DN2067_c0_g1_i3:223-861(+)
MRFRLIQYKLLFYAYKLYYYLLSLFNPLKWKKIMEESITLNVSPVYGKRLGRQPDKPETAEIEIRTTDTIRDLKHKIEVVFNFKAEKQYLSHYIHSLDDDSKTLWHYNLKSGDKVLVVYSRFEDYVEKNDQYQIFYKLFTPGGDGNEHKAQEITIRYLDTVLQVKGIIQQQTGIEVEDQRIIFAGKELIDERILSEYGIQKESTIHVVNKKK